MKPHDYVVTEWVDARQAMSRCQLGDQAVIAVGDGGWTYDQPTIRIIGKRRDGVLDFAGIVLRLAQREDRLRDMIAMAIIDCAQRGIRDPIEMRKCAHGTLEEA